MKSTFFFLFLFATFFANAQVKDSTVAVTAKSITDKFPSTRTFDLQYDQLGSTDNTTRVLDDFFERGKIQNHYRIKAAANIPFYRSKRKTFFLTNSFRYKYESFSFGDLSNDTDTYSRPDADFHYFSNAVTATYFSRLFKKPVLYNASASVDADQYAFQRVKGRISAVLVMKKTANTTMTLGVLATIDPSSIIPFVPIFTYEYQFSNSPWKLDFILPQRLLVKRPLFENARLSLGTELGGENFYLRLRTPTFNGTYELNQLELRSGLTYEHALGGNFIGTFKAGVAHVLSSRITERGERTDKYVVDNKQDPMMYFNLGISYNPF